MPRFICPFCGSASEERIFRFFLQNDTSFYANGSRNIAIDAHSRSLLVTSDVPSVAPSTADFFLCTELDDSSLNLFVEFLNSSRSGACFVFACSKPSPRTMEETVLAVFKRLDLVGYSKIDYASRIEKADRLLYGLTADIPIYIYIKPWRIA